MNTINRINPQRFLPILAFMLIVILPIQGTIAIRHALIGFLFLFSILYLIQIDFISLVKQASWLNLLPMFFLVAFFVWVIAHYFLLSLSPAIELKQLESLWLRVLLISISGLAIGLLLLKKPKYYVWIYAGMLVPGLIVIISHLLTGFNDIPFIKIFLEKTIYADPKLTPGFFITTACALVIPLFYSSKTFKLNLESIIFVLIISCSGLVGTLTSSKNTLIVWGGLVTTLILTSFKQLSKVYRIIFISMMVIFLGLATLNQYKKGFGWSQMPEEIRIGVQIDKYPHWQNRDIYGYPKLESGATVSINTYERFAWGAKGLELIQKYPLGYGVHNGSFKNLLEKEGLVSPSIAFTHSGWIDFTLGMGVPGTLLIWLALASILWASRRNPSVGKNLTLWVIPTIFIYWTIGELSNKHYIEFTFFMISFFIGVNLLNGQVHLLKENRHGSI